MLKRRYKDRVVCKHNKCLNWANIEWHTYMNHISIFRSSDECAVFANVCMYRSLALLFWLLFFPRLLVYSLPKRMRETSERRTQRYWTYICMRIVKSKQRSNNNKRCTASKIRTKLTNDTRACLNWKEPRDGAQWFWANAKWCCSFTLRCLFVYCLHFITTNSLYIVWNRQKCLLQTHSYTHRYSYRHEKSNWLK